MNRQYVIQKFIWGMTSLNSYIYFNNLLNFRDINIFSENFIRDLLNIVDSLKLKNANYNYYNNPGFDLIDQENKILIQVTSTDDPQKVKKTWDTMYRNYQPPLSNTSPDDGNELNLSDYSFLFFVLKYHAEDIKKYYKKHTSNTGCPAFLSFDPKKNVLDLGDLVTAVNDLDGSKLHELETLMLHNWKMFSRMVFHDTPKKVNKIIKEYADNYTARMFLHTYHPESNVSLQNVYVQPKYRIAGSVDDSRDTISLISRFICENPSERMLYIDGDAAVGKTSLISWLCYYYSQNADEDDCLSLRKALFLNKQLVCVRLRELDFVHNRRASEDMVLSYLQIADMREFQRMYDDALIVLEGIDEISMVDNVNSGFLSRFISDIRKAFKNNKLIITGRPHFFDVEELHSEQFSIRHIELMHFDKDMRREWMEKYEECGESIPAPTKNYILGLAEENANGVADTPLALYMLVSCEIRDDLRGNRWALFHEIFRNAIMKTEYNENFSSSSTHPINENADDVYRAVCHIAFKMFTNSSQERYYITSSELDSIINDMDGEDIPRKQLRQCCVLCAYWKTSIMRGALEFYHNDIRDFFFCEYIYDVLKKRLQRTQYYEFISDFLTDMCTVFQHGSISGSTWEQTFEFLYLRLLYESNHQPKDADIIIEGIALHYSAFIGELIGGSNTYCHPFDDISYTRIKHTTMNTLLLLSVVTEIGFKKNQKRHKLLFCPDDESRNQIISSDIFNNWSEMFLKHIKISESKEIRFGRYLNLSQIVFHYADLNEADFSYANLNNAKFEHVNLSSASFSHTSLKGAIFINCDLTNADFSYAIIKDAVFENCIFEQTNFNIANINNTEFRTEKPFSGTFKNAKLSACQMHHLVFEKSVFYNTNFHRVSLNMTNFSAVKTMEKVAFINCNLDMAVFSNMVLKNVDFEQSILFTAQFNKATLQNCSLEKTKLSETNFFRATFQNTPVDKENMSLCNTELASFDGAPFQSI